MSGRQANRLEDVARGPASTPWLVAGKRGSEGVSPLDPADQHVDSADTSMNVLVVEDDALIALDIEQTLLAMGGIAVTVAHRLDDALAILDGRDYDLSILDVDLGAQTSLSIAERLRVEGRPFLFLTGYRSERLRDLGLSEDRLLEKPFTEDALMAQVARLLRRA